MSSDSPGCNPVSVTYQLGYDPPADSWLMMTSRADIDFSHARLERSAIGLAELYRQIHGIVRGESKEPIARQLTRLAPELSLAESESPSWGG